MKAAAVNPTDIGLPQRGGSDDIGPPWVPGMDAAGVIEAVGPGVDRLHAGEEVMAAVSPRRPEGGAQQGLLVVPAASVVPIPEGASPAEAATLPMNGLTARRGLEMLGLTSGDTLAVAGGAGLVVPRSGSFARGVRVHPVMVARVLERTDWLEELRALASSGRIKLRVAGEYPPEEAGEAHRVTDAGGIRGRAVIVF